MLTIKEKYIENIKNGMKYIIDRNNDFNGDDDWLDAEAEDYYYYRNFYGYFYLVVDNKFFCC